MEHATPSQETSYFIFLAAGCFPVLVFSRVREIFLFRAKLRPKCVDVMFTFLSPFSTAVPTRGQKKHLDLYSIHFLGVENV